MFKYSCKNVEVKNSPLECLVHIMLVVQAVTLISAVKLPDEFIKDIDFCVCVFARAYTCIQ